MSKFLAPIVPGSKAGTEIRKLGGQYTRAGEHFVTAQMHHKMGLAAKAHASVPDADRFIKYHKGKASQHLAAARRLEPDEYENRHYSNDKVDISNAGRT